MKICEIKEILKICSNKTITVTNENEYQIKNSSLKRVKKTSPIKYYTTYYMQNDHDIYIKCGTAKNEENKSFKYGMFSYWENNPSDNINSDNEANFAVVIGQNPSYSSKSNVDGTNQNIIKVLHQRGYNSYLQLNTFPVIDPSGDDAVCSLFLEENMQFAKEILEKLKPDKIIIACGETLPVYYPFIEFLNQDYAAKLYCFSYDNEPIFHLSMQSLNCKHKTDIEKFSTLKCTVSERKNTDFKPVKIECR